MTTLLAQYGGAFYITNLIPLTYLVELTYVRVVLPKLKSIMASGMIVVKLVSIFPMTDINTPIPPKDLM